MSCWDYFLTLSSFSDLVINGSLYVKESMVYGSFIYGKEYSMDCMPEAPFT